MTAANIKSILAEHKSSWVLCTCYLSWYSQQPYETGVIIIILILQMRKLRLKKKKKNKQLAQSHIVGKCQSLDSDVGNLVSKPPFTVVQYNYDSFFFICLFCNFRWYMRSMGEEMGIIKPSFCNENTLSSLHWYCFHTTFYTDRK